MKTKKYLVLLLTLLILSYIGSVSASAATKNQAHIDGVMTPQYEQTSSVSNELTVSGKTLYITASTYGYFDANRCGVTATLQKLSGSSWTNYKVWSATSSSSHPDYVILGTSITVSSGQYRLVTSHSVTVGSDTEFEGMISPTRTVS